MDIELKPETEKLLARLFASGRYNTLDDIVGDVAAKLADGPAPMPEHLDPAELARKQGIGPIQDFRSLKADFYPPGETSEEFLRPLYERRRADAPRAG